MTSAKDHGTGGPDMIGGISIGGDAAIDWSAAGGGPWHVVTGVCSRENCLPS